LVQQVEIEMIGAETRNRLFLFPFAGAIGFGSENVITTAIGVGRLT
jgi:hypothetical protein